MEQLEWSLTLHDYSGPHRFSMVNHSLGGSSSLGTCRLTAPWIVDASTRNGASPPWRPAQDYSGIIDSSADQFLGGPAEPRICPPCADPCPQALRRRSARLAHSGRSRASFLKARCPLRVRRWQIPCAVEDELARGEGQTAPSSPSASNSLRIFSSKGKRSRC